MNKLHSPGGQEGNGPERLSFQLSSSVALSPTLQNKLEFCTSQAACKAGGGYFNELTYNCLFLAFSLKLQNLIGLLFSFFVPTHQPQEVLYGSHSHSALFLLILSEHTAAWPQITAPSEKLLRWILFSALRSWLAPFPLRGAENPIPKKSLLSIVNMLVMLKNAFCLFVNKFSINYTLSSWSCSLLSAEMYYFYVLSFIHWTTY